MSEVVLTSELIESFAGVFLSPRYDDARPTAQFHRDGWKLYSSEVKQAMIIAPRDHAKSTAFTFDYILAEALFRKSRYIILIGSTEEMAQEQLVNISDELHENEDLRREFRISKFPVDSKTDVIVEMDDGYQFRILARGAEQRIRGRMWKGMRPDLMVCDDMEDDEQVESVDRRSKFRRWFFRAAKQALSKRGRIRVHGTILHEDSLLNRLRKNSVWKHLFYKAHAAFDDFSDILWPERWSEPELRLKRQEFIDDNDASGYSQEVLNDPFDNSEPYLRKVDFLPMSEEDHELPKLIAVGCDFAVSTRDKANRTSFTIGGKCHRNFVHFLDEYVGRWDTLEWIDVMFDIQLRYNPEVFFVEDGVIWKSILPTLNREMQIRDVWLNCHAVLPVKDKAVRGRAWQKKMRAGGCRFDKSAPWYPGFEAECLRFTGRGDAIADDQFDSAALLVKGFDLLAEVEEDDFEDEDEQEVNFHNRGMRSRNTGGRSQVTGY
jgi:hypothetical protein